MKHLPLLTGLIGIILSVNIYAVELPTIFQAGTPAKAAEVNANFSTLKEAINTLEASNPQKATYHAGDFLPTSNIVKTFVIPNQDPAQEIEIDEAIVVGTNGDGQSTYQVIREDDFNSTGYKFSWVLNSDGYILKENNRYTLGDNQLRKIIYESGILRFPAVFSVGDSWANDTSYSFTTTITYSDGNKIPRGKPSR